MDTVSARYTVALQKVADQFGLKNLTPSLSLEGREVKSALLNRPGLQLGGFYEYFDPERVQIMGMQEYSYLGTFSEADRTQALTKLFSAHVPCLIWCRSLSGFAEEGLIELAESMDVPVFGTEEVTTVFSAKLVQYLSAELAPRTVLHGVMMDIYGEGVLIIGESGLGKSETAVELVMRGHRFVADDVVEIRKTSETELVAQSAELTRNLAEVRGIGVVNLKELYGIQSIRISKAIDMVVRLKAWERDGNYDRLGLEQEFMDILGTKIACYTIPIMVGRNLAMIVETAAVNHRQKKMGYNAAEELKERISRNIEKRKEEWS